MKYHLVTICLVWLVSATHAAETTTRAPAATDFRGALLSVGQVTDARLQTLKAAGTRSVVLLLEGGVAVSPAEEQAIERIGRAALELYYWIEVARCPELADAHPAWMASLQGHTEWRRLFQDPPSPRTNEVVKTYPWVTILNKEPFEAQLERVEAILRKRPAAQGVFLNDIQGAPSACGCGNHLCRWTSDYGDIRTAIPLGNDAPGAFVAAVQALVPRSRVIPVWTTECEEHDGAENGLCAGVGCFKGICWKAFSEQLDPVAKHSETIGVLLPYRAFQRDLPRYGQPAGWVKHSVKTFEEMLVRNRRTAIPSSRLLAVLQGWDVTEHQIAQQVRAAEGAAVGGLLISYAEIEQSWEPRIYRWK